MVDRLVRNKQSAMALYDLMFNESSHREAVERYAGQLYIRTTRLSPTAWSARRVLRADASSCRDRL